MVDIFEGILLLVVSNKKHCEKTSLCIRSMYIRTINSIDILPYFNKCLTLMAWTKCSRYNSDKLHHFFRTAIYKEVADLSQLIPNEFINLINTSSGQCWVYLWSHHRFEGLLNLENWWIRYTKNELRLRGNVYNTIEKPLLCIAVGMWTINLCITDNFFVSLHTAWGDFNTVKQPFS